MGEEIVRRSVEGCAAQKVRVWMSPGVEQEELKCITNGVDGTYSLVVSEVNYKVKFSSSVGKGEDGSQMEAY